MTGGELHREMSGEQRKLRYDLHTGDRWWGDHVHRRLLDEPLNYTGWHEWAKRRKVRQHPCSTPGCPILRWADEVEDDDE